MQNRNLDLFGDEGYEGIEPPKTLVIAGGGERRSLSKTQKAFNALIKQIEARRAEFAAWEAAIPLYQKRYAEEYLPLIEQAADVKTRIVHGLDAASERKGLTKTERRTISRLIVSMAGEIVAERNDEALKAIYNRYSGTDYDSEEAESLDFMKAMLEDVTGIDLGDAANLDSPEDILAHMQQRMREEQAAYETKRQARDERRAAKNKIGKQMAKEAAQQEEAQEISQSIREVYRKLASALHPDREPDTSERARKNALMQRANLAYKKKDLLQLLELQLELEHIDQAAIDNLGEERLKHYNRILKEQLAELSQEVSFVQERFKGQFGFHPFERLFPDRLGQSLDQDIADFRNMLRDMETSLGAFDEAKAFKAWLKMMRQEMLEQDRAERSAEMPYW